MPDIQIMPSILAADMGNLEAACRLSESAGSDGIHIDIMDGHFVPNLSMGPATVQMVNKAVKIQLSVHLMIMRPDRYADAFIQAGADTLLIHIEAPCNVPETLWHIRNAGIRCGITLNPETPARTVRDLVAGGSVDEVLCMTVHPGFGGQSFIHQVLPKIAEIRAMNPSLDLSVDGGLDFDTCVQCAEHGANIFLIGTGLFKQPDMAAEIARIRTETANVYGRIKA